MHILFLTHYFPPEGNAPAIRTHEHCRRWVASGHQVTVVTCAPSVPHGRVYDGYQNRWWQREDVDGINVVRVWTWITPNAGMVRILHYCSYMLAAVIASLRVKSPDVIIATSPQFFCGWAGTLVRWLRRTPFLLEIRDIWPESIRAVGAMKAGFIIRVLEWMEHRMYHSATRIVTVGEGYKQQIEDKIGSAVPIDVIPNGIGNTTATSADDVNEFQNKWNLNGKFVCSYVGTIGMAHELEVVVRAAELLQSSNVSNVVFVLVGEGARRKAIEEMAAQKSLSDYVRFVGLLPHDKVPVALAASDACLVHLKATELFRAVIPSKIFEIMAAERPIIMGVEGLAREIVERSGAGWPMRPGSGSDLANIVQEMASNREELSRRAANAKQFVFENYDRNDLAARYLTIIQQTANPSND